MVAIKDIFEVGYGTSLELNALTEDEDGVNFVSRTARNNGVSARVSRLPAVPTLPGGTLTVALGGSVLETFLQPSEFYTGRDVAVLTPKHKMTEAELLYYCVCIKANHYKYSFGRQANRTLKDIRIPAMNEVPDWYRQFEIPDRSSMRNQGSSKEVDFPPICGWLDILLGEIFDIAKGKRLTKAQQTLGETPFVGATDKNNGVTAYIGQKPDHLGNLISLSYNGSVAEAFYQTSPFCASDDINVLYPRGFELNPEIAMFLIAIIRKEKFRFNYGRKWHLDRMNSTKIKLPSSDGKNPDWELMRRIVNSLPFSKELTER